MMYLVYLAVWLSLLYGKANIHVNGQSTAEDCAQTSYIGAVCEYEPYNEWTKEGRGGKIMEANAQEYLSIAKQAKLKNADILVFPEYGLTGFKTPNDEDDYITLSLRLPSPTDAIIPCLQPVNNEHTYDALKDLSCGARENKIYLVIDLIEWVEEKGERESKNINIFYNTQVVFDRSGQLIARYRKKNLFLEDPMVPGKEDPEEALFDTDFGVTFSLQVCFDILYDEPALHNIAAKRTLDVAMSTLWMDELPSLSAPQMFSSWATGLKVNLLVSNYHNTSKGASGSGIFTGTIAESPYHYVYGNGLKIPALLTRNITTLKFPPRCQKGIIDDGLTYSERKQLLEQPEQKMTKYVNKFLHEDVENFTSAIMKPTGQVVTQTFCHQELCCKATYRLEAPKELNHTYHIIAYTGNVYKARIYKTRIQMCTIAYCLNDNLASCAQVDERFRLSPSLSLYYLSGDFNTKFVFPSILNTSFDLVERDHWKFTNTKSGKKWRAKMITYGLDEDGNNGIIVASLFARIYDKIENN